MESAWLNTGAELWRSFLTRCQHDIYHLPGYVELAAQHDHGVPVAYWSRSEDGEFFIPLIERRIPVSQHLDAVSPYGYPGPLWTGVQDERVLERHWQHFTWQASARGWVSIFLRLHPFLGSRVPLSSIPGQVVEHGQTYSADLSAQAPQYWQQISKQSRRRIKKLKEKPFKLLMDDWSTYAPFVRIYQSTMLRRSSQAYYHFSSSYFEKLPHVLRDRVHLCTVLNSDEQVIAGSLYFHCGDIVQAHLGGAHDDWVQHNPMRLVDFESAAFFRSQGATIVHLGGGLGGEQDGLASYKRSMSGASHRYFTARMILQPAVYDDLNAGQVTAYFPAYRAPGVPQVELNST